MDNEGLEGMEPFNMDNDFEGGEFVDGEFYFEQRRKKRKQTKEQQIYGVFLSESEGSEDGEDEDDGFRGKKKRGGGGNPLGFKPVGFVSSGVIGGEKKDKSKKNNKESESEDEESEGENDNNNNNNGYNDEDDDGFSHRGLGSSKKSKSKSKSKPKSKTKKEKEEEVFNKTPAFFGKSKKKPQKVEESDVNNPPPLFGTTINDGLNKYGPGHKMLKLMGWKGGGLGVGGKGMAEPIDVMLRPKGLGLGNIQEKTKQQLRQEALKTIQLEKANEKEESEEEGSDRDVRLERILSSRKKKTLYEFDSSEKPTVKSDLVVDMRGPEARIISKMEDLVTNDIPSAGPLQALMHNLSLLEDMSDSNVSTTKKQIAHNKEKIITITNEKEKLKKRVDQCIKITDSVTSVIEIIEKCVDEVKSGNSSLNSVTTVFSDLHSNYNEIWVSHRLSHLALDLAQPLLKKSMENWGVLSDPGFGVAVFSTWKNILSTQADSEVYSQIIFDVILPKLRSGFADWKVREFDRGVRILNIWRDLLPVPIWNIILDQLVFNRLKEEVEKWEPRTDVVLIHSWIHPWIPLLENKMEPLYQPIRFKLGSALQEWYPSDCSAHIVLSPWLKVFGKEGMEALLDRSVIPKLVNILKNVLSITPSKQNLDPINWVLSWTDMISQNKMVQMLEKEFFPKWLEALHEWLSKGANFVEVERWYKGWKGLFAKEILDDEIIKTQFNKALQVIDLAVEGKPIPRYERPVSPPKMLPPQTTLSKMTTETKNATTTTNNGNNNNNRADLETPRPISTPELLEDVALENELLFIRSKKRDDAGHPIYNFGLVPIIFEKNLVCVQDKKTQKWKPISIELLISKAKLLAKKKK